MKNKATQALEYFKGLTRSKSFVGTAVTAALTAASNAQGTAPADLVTFTGEVKDIAENIAAGMPAAGLAGLTLFAVWYGIVMAMKVFKTVA